MKDFLSLGFLATTSPPFHNVVGRNAIVNAAESLKGQLVATTVVSSSGVGGEGGGMADKRRPQGRANRHVGGGGRGGLDSHLAVFPAPSPCSVVITRICGAVSRHQEKWHRPLDGGVFHRLPDLLSRPIGYCFCLQQAVKISQGTSEQTIENKNGLKQTKDEAHTNSCTAPLAPRGPWGSKRPLVT